MDVYQLKITTWNDGVKSSVSALGKLTNTEKGRAFIYRQGDGDVTFYIDDARMVRKGDFYLELSFQAKEVTSGKLAIGDHVGELPIKTLSYLVEETENTITITTKYILKQEGGYQSMKVCIEGKSAAKNR